MRHFKLTLLLLLFAMCCCPKLQSQNFYSDGKKNLIGNWNGECALEFTSWTTVRHCKLCPLIVDTINSSTTFSKIQSVSLEIQSDSIKIGRSGEIETVIYSLDNTTHSIHFTTRGKIFDFRVLYYEDHVLWEDNDGLVIVFTRSKHKHSQRK